MEHVKTVISSQNKYCRLTFISKNITNHIYTVLTACPHSYPPISFKTIKRNARFSSDTKNLDSLKAQIRERLEAEYSGAARSVMKRKLLDEMDKMVSFELPPSLVEAEGKQIAHQLWHEENPEVQGHDHGEIEVKEEHTELASRRVRLGLLLADLGQRANIEVSEQEMTQALIQQARQYPGQEREFFEFMQQNQQMQQQMRAPIYEDKVVDYVLELADVTDKSVSKDDLEKAIEALEKEDA